MNISVTPLFTNAFRSVVIGKREFLVVPGVPAREQVMNTYLVPGEEIASSVRGWNGTDISIQHPTLNDGSVKVPAPDVAIIGRFYNAKWDAPGRRMTGEYWIDVTESEKYAEGVNILNAIKDGRTLETSTGYWADDEMTAGEFEGRQYKTIHRNLLPDHIAILTKATGACSIKDGCGVNRNETEDHECDCDCPFKTAKVNEKLPDFQKDHLPTMMLIAYSFNKGSRTAEQIESLRAYIAEKGIVDPVMVMRKDDGEIRILDGNHRVAIAGEQKIEQIPVKVVDERLQPLDPEMVYSEWLHRKDQSYMNVSDKVKNHPMYSDSLYKEMFEKGMSEDEMMKKMDGMKTESAQTNSQLQVKVEPVLKISRKESVMKFKEMVQYLTGKGISVKANDTGDEFEVEETPIAGEPVIDKPSLSTEEISALKSLAALAPKLNTQLIDNLGKVPLVVTMAQNYETQQKAEKDALIAAVKMNASNNFSNEELEGMSVSVLAKLNAQGNVNYAGTGGGAEVFTNVSSPLRIRPVMLMQAEEE